MASLAMEHSEEARIPLCRTVTCVELDNDKS